MMDLETGKFYKLIRPTYLHKGFLVLQNSKVELKQVNSDSTVVIVYLDREMNPHDLIIDKADLAML